MSERGVLGSARVVAACTLTSRLLGLLRDILCARYFGVGPVWDAFTIAYRVPNLFRRLFGEGALTAAFVPPFVARLEQGRSAEAHLLLRRLATLLGLFLALVTLLGILATYALPKDEKTLLTASLLRIMLPYLPLICVAALLGGALNGLRHFFTPAFAPVLLNLVWITAILTFRHVSREEGVSIISWSILAGGILQLLSMATALRMRGVTLRPDLHFTDPGLRDVAGRFTPVVFGLALVQINELVDSLIAEIFVPGHGAVSSLYYGNQITQLPLSLIGTSIATAAFPSMAAAFAGGRTGEFADLVRKSLRGALFLAVPATFGLVFFPSPIIQILFERGAFTAPDTARTATVLSCYALSLWCYCSNQIQVRAYYALGDTRTPVRVSAGMVGLNLALNLSLVGWLQEAGIALATSITGLGSFLILQRGLRNRIAGSSLGLVPLLFRYALLSSIMVLAGHLALTEMSALFPGDSIRCRAIRLGSLLASSVIVYFGLDALIRCLRPSPRS